MKKSPVPITPTQAGVEVLSRKPAATFNNQTCVTVHFLSWIRSAGAKVWAERQRGRAVWQSDGKDTDISQPQAQWKELATTNKISGWQLFRHHLEHLFITSNNTGICKDVILQQHRTNVYILLLHKMQITYRSIVSALPPLSPSTAVQTDRYPAASACTLG